MYLRSAEPSLFLFLFITRRAPYLRLLCGFSFPSAAELLHIFSLDSLRRRDKASDFNPLITTMCILTINRLCSVTRNGTTPFDSLNAAQRCQVKKYHSISLRLAVATYRQVSIATKAKIQEGPPQPMLSATSTLTGIRRLTSLCTNPIRLR